MRDIGDRACCSGGVGKALGCEPLDVLRSNCGEGRLVLGENGGVWTEASIDPRDRADSGLGVVRHDPPVELM